MSDRLVMSLATIPMFTGVLLLGLMQRTEASEGKTFRAGTGAAIQAASSIDTRAMPWVGVVTAGSNADLRAEFDGRVTKVWVKSGAQVKEGQPLLEIDRAEVATTVGVAGAELGQRNSDVERAAAKLEAARVRLKRIEAGGRWMSAQELDMARTETRVAEAELSAARSSVNMGRARLAQQRLHAQKHTLVAPFTGTLVNIDVDPGDTVSAGEVLARVISNERQIRFALPRTELAEHPLSEVLVRLKDQEGSLRAPVNAVRPEVDSAAQLVFATAALPEQVRGLASWMPGSVVEVLAAPPADAAMKK